MPKPAVMPNGCLITACVGCEEQKPQRYVGPVRDSGDEYLHEFNWLRTCKECGRRLCLVCLPDPKERCIRCQEIDARQGAAA